MWTRTSANLIAHKVVYRAMVPSLLVALLLTLPAAFADGHQSLISHRQLSKHGDSSTNSRKNMPKVVIDLLNIGGTGIPPQGPSTISASKTPPATKTASPSPPATKTASQTSSTPPPSKAPTSTRSPGHPSTPAPTPHSATPGHPTSSTHSNTPTFVPPPAGGGGADDPDPTVTTSTSSTQRPDPPTRTTDNTAPTSPAEVFPDSDECSADSECGSGSSCCFFNDFANVCVAAGQCSAKGACRYSGQTGSCGERGPDRCFENSDCGANKPICCSFSDVGNICIKASACTTGQCLSGSGTDIGVCDNPDGDLNSTPQCGSDSDCSGRKVCCDFGGEEPSQCIRLTACVHNACRSTSGRYGGCDSG